MSTSNENTVWLEKDIAYLAGLIDGEGCITITRGIDRRRSGYRGNRQYHPVLLLTNTHEGMIKWVHTVFGGRVYVRASGENWQKLYTMQWYSKKCTQLLHLILPYLRIKRWQAVVVLELFSLMSQTKCGVALSDAALHRRELLCNLIRKLNAKGPNRLDAERLSEEASQVLGMVRQSELQGIEPVEAGRNVQSA